VAAQRLRGGAAGGGEDFAPAVDAAVGDEPVDRAAQVVDGRVAEVEEVAGGAGGPGALVDGDDRDRDVLAGVDRDHGQVERQVAQAVGGRLVRGQDDDAVDRLGAQPPDRLLDGLPAEHAQAGDADAVAAQPGRLLDAVERGRGTVQSGVDADHAEHAGTAGDELACGQVGPVVELADG